MSKNFFYIILFLLISCSSSTKITKVPKPDTVLSAEILYKRGLDSFNNGDYIKAIELLKKIETDDPYSFLVPKSILMISYIYYESNEYIQALESLKKFKNLYPINKNIAYAEFLTGICLYEQINNVSNDATPSLLALKQFNMIINTYPKTIYAEESKIRIDLIKEQLAGHEMYFARYYMNKEKWISAILRLQTVIEKYPTTIFAEEALHRLVEVHYRIGNLEFAKKYAAILGYNFNTGDWYKKTYKIVGDKNFTNIDKKNKKSFKNKLLSIFNLDKDD